MGKPKLWSSFTWKTFHEGQAQASKDQARGRDA